jgi:hypothetical protein
MKLIVFKIYFHCGHYKAQYILLAENCSCMYRAAFVSFYEMPT